MKNFVITIARGFGSGGKEIASEVAKDFGIHCYENRILTLASQLSGLDESHFAEVDERPRSRSILSELSNIPHTLDVIPVTKKFVSDRKLFEYQAEIIRDLASTESCVIVGKCADFVLRDFDNVASFYIEAPRYYCRDSVIRRMGVTGKEADKLITQTDQYRANYYKHYTGGNYWTNPINYDMTLNAERVGREKCVKIIEDYVRLKFDLQ